MLASATLVTEEEYLRSNYKPACDYIDGVLRQKSMPTFDHAEVQHAICMLIRRLGGYVASPELTCWFRKGKFLVPDVAAQRLDEVQRPYPTRPIHLCIWEYHAGLRPNLVAAGGVIAAGPISLSCSEILESPSV
jgi:hypothetical protein